VVTLNIAAETTELDLPALVVHGTHDASAPREPTGRR
jgi:hypothetical protein